MSSSFRVETCNAASNAYCSEESAEVAVTEVL